MFIMPNKLNWGKCPHCEITINSHDDFSVGVFGNPYFTKTKCPSCKKDILVKVKIEFTYEIEKE